MNTYNGRDSEMKFPIVVKNTQPSEYQTLIDDFILNGGKVQKIPMGVSGISEEQRKRFDAKVSADLMDNPIHADSWAQYLSGNYRDAELDKIDDHTAD